jgi:hypothetical protein
MSINLGSIQIENPGSLFGQDLRKYAEIESTPELA